MKFTVANIDHVGIRVIDREVSQRFYEKLGFVFDPEEDLPEGRSIGLVNRGRHPDQPHLQRDRARGRKHPHGHP